ncbi:MAG: hypothetical protein ABI193_06010 [Minicystis sp.]
MEIVHALGLAEHTIGDHKLRARCAAYLREHGLSIDDGGQQPDYDLVFHCSELIWPRNLTGKKVILVQEGMTDPESVLFPLIKRFDFLPRWLAGISATGLSHKYTRFCVASEGYQALFASRGVDPEKWSSPASPISTTAAATMTTIFPTRATSSSAPPTCARSSGTRTAEASSRRPIASPRAAR